MHLEAGEIVPLRGVAHGAGDMREAVAVFADEVPGTVAEAKDEEPQKEADDQPLPFEE